MMQNETERHFEMNDLDQRMRDAYRDGQPVLSKARAAAARHKSFLIACALVSLIAVLLAILTS
ncbi:hypothetical protein [Ensifer sp.]|uniref:hypothetical protein n=1 Tax=Ensifer sp. TaxID=1872086 RepID=UPI002E100EF1|nr:hypothetical protein [Ensifer sp.]